MKCKNNQSHSKTKQTKTVDTVKDSNAHWMLLNKGGFLIYIEVFSSKLN